MRIRRLMFLAANALLALVLLTVAGRAPSAADATGGAHFYLEAIPVVDLAAHGYEPVAAPETMLPDDGVGGVSDAPLAKEGVTVARPGSIVQYTVRLTNYEAVTRTYHLSDALPPQLEFTRTLSDGLTYDAATRTLHWEGALAPGHLDYVIEGSSSPLPYLDLAGFGVPNLCDLFQGDEETCDEVAVTFNLGVNDYVARLYGQPLSQLTISDNGVVAGGETAVAGRPNQWLPDPASPGLLLAGLWRDGDFSGGGRWHAAIVAGLLEGYDLFYAQWHDAPHAADVNLTARHAVAIVLERRGDDAPPVALAGHAFFIYDNVSDPAATAAQGYTIGVEDQPGGRGLVYAYAPCCGGPHPPQGQPPAAGVTLHLRPVLFGAERPYQRTFGYEVQVVGQTPDMAVNTARATSSSPDPFLAERWASHYLYIRQQAFLPLVQGRP